ncbi:MAG: aspartate dehydrogenase domain-containing protein [Syntrophorhabdales bacterium]|jgi:aspartate dehydrogenase
MNHKGKKSIGLIGFGQIGSFLYREISKHPEYGLEIAFVHDVVSELTAALPRQIILEQMEDFGKFGVDLVAEVAHPDCVRQYGPLILEQTDFFMLSVTAMADASLEEKLRRLAELKNRKLYIAHGATVGLDGIQDGRDTWEKVSITMKKNPKNISFDCAKQWDPSKFDRETVIYDGPTRGICPLFPKNVNSHATLALAGIGLDRTRSILVADPKLDLSVIEIEAEGAGNRIHILRTNPIKGVSGMLTLMSVLESIRRVQEAGPGLQIL